MDTSKFHIYAVGTAAENKKISSLVLMVTPHETMSLLDGDIKSNPQTPEVSGKNAADQSYTAKATTDTAVSAKWYPQHSNRRTPPDVRRGERVILWKYGDTDTFYWTETGWDDHLRKLETVIYTFSGTKDEGVDGTTPDNCYYLEVSTHTGLITLHTSKANGEFCVYALQINAKDGTVVLADDLGNEFSLDSKNTKIELTNALKTTLQLDKQKIFAHADDSITFDSKNLFQIDTKDVKINCTSLTLTNKTTTLNSQTTTINGAVAFKGAVTFTQPIQCAGITSTAPIHGPSDTI